MSGGHAARRVAVGLAWRPEWPAAAVAALAWSALLLGQSGAGGALQPQHAAHLATTATSTMVGMLAPALGGWALMAVAMMVPATLPAVRHVGLNSIRRRRQRAMALYLGAYIAVWVAFGSVALLAVHVAGGTGLTDRQLIGVTLVLATAWQLTATKRRAVLACRRTVPLPPSGLRADAACVRFGLRQARRCVISCWPVMLLMAVVGHGGPITVIIMALLTVVVVAEERGQRWFLPPARAVVFRLRRGLGVGRPTGQPPSRPRRAH